jgi:UDP-N-acetylglucosamine 2-epimerase (non-hydrolysing)
MNCHPIKIVAAVGTRPEAIKMAPLLRLLKSDGRFRVRLCSTSQHQELLPAALRTLRLKPDVVLKLPRLPRKLKNSPAGLLKKLVPAVEKVLRRRRPDLVLVQGDTTSALSAALAARGLGIPVGHVEAGLRTFDLKNPFPEERNRVQIDSISQLLFAPTRAAKANLLREGHPSERVFVTGNTGIDSLLWAIRRRPARPRSTPAKKFAVVTLHRRESFGPPLEKVLGSILEAADRIPDLTWVFPVHLNPRVREAASRLLVHPRINLAPPLDYPDFIRLMKRASFLVTDSGGIQEEAPSLGKHVLVIRNKTERPELLPAGGSLIGTSRRMFLRKVRWLARAEVLHSPAVNPFGDGKASRRILRAILYWAGKARARPADWGA